MKSLFIMANEINELAKSIDKFESKIFSARVEIGKRLIDVENRLKLESNMTITEWCRNHIRKSDGTPFSPSTIRNYMMFARKPEQLEKDRQQKRAAMRIVRESLKQIDSDNIDNGTVSDQVNRLVFAWDRASDQARNIFLEIVNIGDKARVKYMCKNKTLLSGQLEQTTNRGI